MIDTSSNANDPSGGQQTHEQESGNSDDEYENAYPEEEEQDELLISGQMDENDQEQNLELQLKLIADCLQKTIIMHSRDDFEKQLICEPSNPKYANKNALHIIRDDSNNEFIPVLILKTKSVVLTKQRVS